MADTRPQVEAEDWVRRSWLREKYSQEFYRERMKLDSGGVFDFDAVSADKKIIASISTSQARTATGKHAVGKIMKLRSDMLFLTMAERVEKRLLVLTSVCMFEQCEKEKIGGRTPRGIEFLLAEIPDELEKKLFAARSIASEEVTPKGRNG